MHSASARRFLYFLLVTLLINAGGWTFNREAVADMFFGEQETVATAVESAPQTGHLYSESIKAKTPCNHWCHESAHFLGLFGQALTLSPKKPVEGYLSQITRFIPEPVPEDLFRPPRLLS